ncbi:MAG: hypothetical protein ABSG34_11010 [Candidatus Sulfotelmatobacter sp.]
MKRIALLLCVALACAGIGRAAYHATVPPELPLSKFVPAGPLLYLEAKDFSSLLNDWNSSPQKAEWIRSDSYEVFSRSRLFLRLKGAGDQFAAAAGLPPDMDFLSQVAGQHSALAVYDIGKLQFLYIAYLPSARSMQTTLWQTRAKFEPRNAGGVQFYLRRDTESQREVAFAVAGDYLLLATREDLMAGALQLISGKPDRIVEDEQWWAQSTAAAGPAGDLRMVLDLQSLVPNGYFRTYWVQKNITDLSQYSAAVSDLFRTGKQYREERVLIRKKEPAPGTAPENAAAVADLINLVPDDAGVYVASAGPMADACFALLETKLLAPHLGPAPASQLAPQVQLTSGEQGSASDLETRIDQAPPENTSESQSESMLKTLLGKTSILASLQVQSTQRDPGGVFVRLHSAVVLAAATDWDASTLQSAIAEFVRPGLTAGQFGMGWQPRSGFQQLDGLWPLAVAVRGKYVVITDDPLLMEAVLSNFSRKLDRKPADFVAGFNHQRERANFARFTGLIDRPNGNEPGGAAERQPRFFSGNMTSLSATLAGVSSERIEIHNDGGKVRQTVTYEWSQ